jgi:hypothetical protein
MVRQRDPAVRKGNGECDRERRAERLGKASNDSTEDLSTLIIARSRWRNSGASGIFGLMILHPSPHQRSPAEGELPDRARRVLSFFSGSRRPQASRSPRDRLQLLPDCHHPRTLVRGLLTALVPGPQELAGSLARWMPAVAWDWSAGERTCIEPWPGQSWAGCRSCCLSRMQRGFSPAVTKHLAPEHAFFADQSQLEPLILASRSTNRKASPQAAHLNCLTPQYLPFRHAHPSPNLS